MPTPPENPPPRDARRTDDAAPEDHRDPEDDRHPTDILREDAIDTPDWLLRWTPADGFDAARFFGERTVFYPGSGQDGHEVAIFNGARAACCFVRCDYLMTRARIFAELGRAPFIGYRRVGQVDVPLASLVPDGFDPHLDYSRRKRWSGENAPFAFMMVFERERERDEDHGAKRIAVLFVGADGIETFDAIYAQDHGRHRPPYAILVQDHGFGANWARFGAGGELQWLVAQAKAWPRWLAVGRSGTDAWSGYGRATETPHVSGEWQSERELYERTFALDKGPDAGVIDELGSHRRFSGHLVLHEAVGEAVRWRTDAARYRRGGRPIRRGAGAAAERALTFSRGALGGPQMYVWFHCEGWFKRGPYRWLHVDEQQRLKAHTGETVATREPGFGRWNVPTGGGGTMAAHAMVITTDGTSAPFVSAAVEFEAR